jgi:hypothetical protein
MSNSSVVHQQQPRRFNKVLTTKLCAVMIDVLCSFLVGCACNVEQTVDAGLHGICALIPKLEWLLRVGSVFVDGFVNQALNWQDVLRSAELEQLAEEANAS